MTTSNSVRISAFSNKAHSVSIYCCICSYVHFVDCQEKGGHDQQNSFDQKLPSWVWKKSPLSARESVNDSLNDRLHHLLGWLLVVQGQTKVFAREIWYDHTKGSKVGHVSYFTPDGVYFSLGHIDLEPTSSCKNTQDLFDCQKIKFKWAMNSAASSAYMDVLYFSVPLLRVVSNPICWALLISLCKGSIVKMKGKGERGSPCLTPLQCSIFFLDSSLTKKVGEVVFHKEGIQFLHLNPNPKCSMMFSK
jgi:hypothetical protein